MIEILIFLIAMLLAVISYKIGTGDWFFPDLEDPAPTCDDPATNQFHDDPATVATSAVGVVP